MKSIRTFLPNFAGKLVMVIGLILFLCISAWAYLNTQYYREKLMEGVMMGTDKLTNTIRLGAHYAMTLNSRDDINQIINNVGKQQGIESIRIFNKAGQIKFSSIVAEKDQVTDIKARACHVCHQVDPPLTNPDLRDRVRVIGSSGGKGRMLGVISPIYNEPSCSSAPCHFHSSGKQILGALDVVISLEETDKEIARYEKGIFTAAVSILLLTSIAIYLFISRFLNKPVKKLIDSTRSIASGNYSAGVDINRNDEIGQLAVAFDKMGREICEKEAELKIQRDEYQELFELAPCIITVQDKDYRILRYNDAFADLFNPMFGDYCYHAYKGLNEKCLECPVEKTFADGMPHYSEETVYDKDGKPTLCWIVKAVPIKDINGDIVAVMEMCLDITYKKQLEQELENTVKKYYAIFNNIANAVFVLAIDTLGIIDCNESATVIYGYERDELIGRPFLDLMAKDEQSDYSLKLQTSSTIEKVRQIHKSGRTIYVTIRVTPSEYERRNVLLVSTSDITKRLETEQQLVQAGKMSTLGEMATGVAHELNQPLSVIKTASNFLMKKVRKNEKIKKDILFTMASEIDSHVDRATKIMNHMRQFGRKSDMTLEKIQVNDVLKRAFEFFSAQLKLREIEVVWDMDDSLPRVMGDAGRLEQVIVNLLINARDAIDERSAGGAPDRLKRITLKTWADDSTWAEDSKVVIEISDTGKGIPVNLLQKIFEPFFTTKQVGKGTGLGLYISYGIVQDCGGSIRAVSRQGGGATFIITFPIAGA